MLAEECLALLAKHVVNQPLPLLMPLLSCAFHTQAGEDDLIQGIIVSHGRSTASSIAGIANQLTAELTQHLTDEQWQEWMTLAEERGVCGPGLDGLRTMQTAFKTVVPDEIRGRLQAGADREGWFDPRLARKQWRLEWLNFRALPSTAARLRWLGQYLFPDADYIRRKYGIRHSLWVPWFYGVRIVQGVAKRIRQGH